MNRSCLRNKEYSVSSRFQDSTNLFKHFDGVHVMFKNLNIDYDIKSIMRLLQNKS